jgi:hypothetical protein
MSSSSSSSAAAAAALLLLLQTSQHVLHFFRDSPLFIEYNCSTPLQSSSSSKKQKGPAKRLLDGLIPLCMEFLTDALATNTCTVLSVLGPTAAAAAADVAHESSSPAAGSDARQEVLTELLLQQLGFHLITASHAAEPPAALSYLLNDFASISSTTAISSTTRSSSGNADTVRSAEAAGGHYRHIQVLLEHPPRSSEDQAAADAEQGRAVPLLSLLRQDLWDVARQQQQQQRQVDEQLQQQEHEDARQEKQQQQQEVDRQQQEQQEGSQQEEQQQQQANPEQAAQAHTPEAPQQLQRRWADTMFVDYALV